ncbi:leucine-rich repeat domain-containing protein [Lentzea sp. NPDC059081]|uniref:leucine-rich repeat domain-containing protein n=1 Tax=Lentzea sp. NPDC059081 TaxID=3346719 RepID=UPI0036A19CF4
MHEEISRALRGTPNPLAFRALCAAVMRAGADPDLLAWCDGRLGSWPDATRRAPYSWVAALEAGFTKPVWRLVRSLDLTGRAGMRVLDLPDPRDTPEVRAVTDLRLAPFAVQQTMRLPEIAEHWEGLRSVEFGGLMKFEAPQLGRFLAGEVATRLEALVLVRAEDDLRELPPVRIDRPTRLRHAGLRAPDLVHLLRTGLAPGLRSAEVLVASAGEARDLAGCPAISSLDRLAIGFHDDTAAQEFFSRADITNLSGLAVHGTSRPVSFDGMARLRHLDLSGRTGRSPHHWQPEVRPIGDVTALTGLVRLKSLNLAATGLTRQDLRVVAELPLEHLDVSSNPVGGLPSVPWPTLRSVRLDNCGLGDDDLTSLPPEAPLLESISLAHNDIRSDGARTLARWPVLPQLWEMCLHDNVIGDDGLVDLARSRAAQRLLELDLEQDVGTAHHRRTSVPLPPEVVDGESFPNLDSMYLGLVDGYHLSRWSAGFPAELHEELIRTGRPALVAFLTHVKLLELLDDEDPDPDPPVEDFRTSGGHPRGRP